MTKKTIKGIRLVENGPQTNLIVDKRIYPLDVLMSACYTFIDRAYFLIERPDKDHFQVIIALKPDKTDKDLGKIVGEVQNQLLEEALRAKIGRKTAKIRDRIVTTALAYSIERPRETQEESLEDLPPEVLEVLQSDDDDLDFLDDPLGIAVPWEEKFEKDKKSDNTTKDES